MLVIESLWCSWITLLTGLSPIVIFVGSVQIDEAFEELFEKKLQLIRHDKPDLFRGGVVQDDEAREVAKDLFQKIKVNWGTGRANIPNAKFSVPELPQNLWVDCSK